MRREIIEAGNNRISEKQSIALQKLYVPNDSPVGEQPGDNRGVGSCVGLGNAALLG